GRPRSGNRRDDERYRHGYGSPQRRGVACRGSVRCTCTHSTGGPLIPRARCSSVFLLISTQVRSATHAPRLGVTRIVLSPRYVTRPGGPPGIFRTSLARATSTSTTVSFL